MKMEIDIASQIESVLGTFIRTEVCGGQTIQGVPSRSFNLKRSFIVRQF